jgi:hypothetical protein
LNSLNNQFGFKTIGKPRDDGNKQKRQEWLNLTIGNQYNQYRDDNQQEEPHGIYYGYKNNIIGSNK